MDAHIFNPIALGFVLMSGLNPQQYEAVFYRKGPLLVLAGAGSGKTKVITERIAALIERDVPFDALTAVTFTNKAAKEMRGRLRDRLGKTSAKLRICTFHSLGLSIVREYAERVGRQKNLSVFAGREQRAALRTVLQEMALPTDSKQLDSVMSRLSAVKSGMIKSDDSNIPQILERYDALLQQMNAVDFDDLMLLPVLLLREHEDARAQWRARARHFLVDEYQDSNALQYELVQLLVPADGNLTVVGDDDQSIYGWRGAEVKNLFQLEKDYPSLYVIRLEENYRSTAVILTAANRLISRNSQRMGKELRSNMGEGKPLRVWECDMPEDEAERVAANIRAQHASTSSNWEDICILYRASYQSRPLELALRTQDIPYHVSGGTSFFERTEIADLLAYLQLIANNSDDLSFMRAITKPRRGIGDRALAELGAIAVENTVSLLEAARNDGLSVRKAEVFTQFASMITDLDFQFQHHDADRAFDLLLENSGLLEAIRQNAAEEKEAERRVGNMMELRRWWCQHAENGGTLPGFMQMLHLLSDREEEEPEGRVRLMTVHAAKGLEFDHLYLIGLEDGSFPHKNALDENRMEEERRLMYVAITRARYRLTLSYAKKRRRFGQSEKMQPSQFLKEIEGEGVNWVDRDTGSEDALSEAQAHMAQMRQKLGLGDSQT
ncbi:MAG: 3'-5' exonuclease [Mariprofundaceae bacterium]